ncbi:MAG: HlyC/CorC family transporter [Chloroflexi bacterium]|nr:HlyC/CorC family transporter [Chloroflexota bacterium]
MDALLRLLAVATLILLNAFFVSAEYALVTVRRSRVEQLVSEGSRSATALSRAKDDPNRFVSGTQLGITMTSLGLGWIGEATIADLIESLFRGLPEPVATISIHTVAVVISFMLITFLHIVLGEQVPKMVALTHSERIALLTVGPIDAFRQMFFPFIALLAGATDLALRLLGIGSTTARGTTVHSAEELEFLVQASHQAGAIQDIERSLLSEVFDFGELTVGQVMVPRRDVIALSLDTSLDELLDVAERTPHTRFPVYDGTIDNVVGTIHLREVLLAFKHAPVSFSLRSILHPPLLIPDSASMEHALVEFRRAEARIAIVFDEYGGTAGLISVEDLVGEIFGRIGDEFHHEVPEIQPQPDNSALISPRVLLEEFNERFGQRLESEEVDTVGGFVLEQLGRMAERGDQVTLKDGSIRVEAVDGVRITQLRYIPAPRRDHDQGPGPGSGGAP